MRNLKTSIAYQEYASEIIVRQKGKHDSKQKPYKLVLFINIFYISSEYLHLNYHLYNKRLINNLIHLSYLLVAICLVSNLRVLCLFGRRYSWFNDFEILIKYVITKFKIWNSIQFYEEKTTKLTSYHVFVIYLNY